MRHESPWILTGLSGVAAAKEFPVTREGLRLGRTADNDFVIPEGNISRHHVSFFFREGTLWVKDLGSKNGTFVNEQRVTESPLHPEDILRLAEFRFRVSREPPPTGPETDDIPLPPPKKRYRSGPLNRRAILYLAAGTTLALLFGAPYLKKLPSLLGGGTTPVRPAVQAVPTASLPKIDAREDEVVSWKVRADAAVGFDDMAAAVSLLRKVVAARPEDLRSRALLARCETRLREKIASYDASGAREFEKLYFDRAIREWRKVLALAREFDPEAYRKAEKRIREAEAEQARNPR